MRVCVCVWVLCLHIWLCALCKQKPEEDSDFLELKLQIVAELPCGCREPLFLFSFPLPTALILYDSVSLCTLAVLEFAL